MPVTSGFLWGPCVILGVFLGQHRVQHWVSVSTIMRDGDCFSALCAKTEVQQLYLVRF